MDPLALLDFYGIITNAVVRNLSLYMIIYGVSCFAYITLHEKICVQVHGRVLATHWRTDSYG